MKLQYDRELLSIREDEEKLNRFIQLHKSFIASCVYKTLHHYVTESDDAFQIGSIAFYEAIRSYDGKKGPFLPFAALVIKRRLIDDQEKEKRHNPQLVYPAAELSDENNKTDFSQNLLLSAEEAQSRRLYEESQSAADIRDEIAELNNALTKYGISFWDLPGVSPKSAKTRQACECLVTELLKNPALYNQMKATKTLPIAELIQMTGLSRKLIERHRKYLITATEIIGGTYPHLREYVPPYPYRICSEKTGKDTCK